ncbi:hypothetical protein M422DRAFT_55159 [Sphaerobolus stellatus SS14]|uniref:FAD/NAD(P)-binding domain-containing protein n=1 Tax=Sphaerobolus stellatus (strain SS14) TaxID=990650 RepID=A0A0C9TDB2_SPHS4|nr:hypothetical protein M422DRAFT_55159 [Sphaerobolus stellatus SS14]
MKYSSINWKYIVVVGLSAAGTDIVSVLLAKPLPDNNRIIAIERPPFAYWGVGSLRAAVIPGWEEKVIMSLNNVCPEDESHKVLAATPVVSLSERTIEIDRTFPEPGLHERFIPFDFCVLATGSVYPFPTRPHQKTKEEAIDDSRQTQRELAEAELSYVSEVDQ